MSDGVCDLDVPEGTREILVGVAAELSRLRGELVTPGRFMEEFVTRATGAPYTCLSAGELAADHQSWWEQAQAEVQ
jgi:hypothetical protein